MAVHVPSDPARLHAKQVCAQADVQQTPSTQKPLVHWPAFVHAALIAPFGWHLPAAQKDPAWQSVGPTQVSAQMAPMQMLGAQLREVPAVQTPCPVHVLTAVSVAPTHPPGAHTLPAA